MSSNTRDESSRSRRRRRRGPSGNRSDNDFHQQQQHQQSSPSHIRSSTRRPYTSPSSSSNPPHPHPRSERDRQREYPSSISSPTVPRPSVETSSNDKEKEARQIEAREKEQREKEQLEREAREKEAREEAQRLAQLAEQVAKRHEERLRNLPYLTDEESNFASTVQQHQQQSQSPQAQLIQSSSSSSQPAPLLHQQQQQTLPPPSPHLQQQRPSDAELRQLDSSLKKCTGFLRKIRAMGVNEESVSSLGSEARSLNLSRYISEVVSAMAESKLRSGDVIHFVTMAGQMHRRYEEFTPQLISSLTSIILPTNPPPRDLPARKAAMRILSEMFIVAMYSDVNHITNVLRQLMRSASRDSKDEGLNSLSIVSSFVRVGSRCLFPRSISSSSSDVTSPHAEQSVSPPISSQPEGDVAVSTELPVNETSDGNVASNNDSGNNGSPDNSWEDNVVAYSTKISVLGALQTYLDNDVERLVKDATEDFQKAGEVMARSKQIRDTPDNATITAFDSAKQYCDKVISAANVLAEALDKPVYPPPSESPTIGDGAGSMDPTQVFVANSFSYVSKNRNAVQDLDVMQSADHPFETDEQRMFYTELIEVESLVPNAKGSGSSEKGGEKKGESSGAPPRRESKKKSAEKAASMERLLNKLPNVETKDSADTFVQQYVLSREGSRSGTKRLSRALFTVSPQKLHVLPAYARIAASLQPLYGGDIGSSVSASLQDDFRFFAGKAEIDDKNLAICIKCSHYVGEYVKFGIISIPTMFELLSLCMKDLSAHRIDAACHLLESCGRFVFRTFSSHIRMSNILDTLWRVKSVRNLEARHNTLIENAFYAVRLSPGSKAQKVKTRPPIHEYIRHLIYHRLDVGNVTWTRNQLLKLPWDDDLEFYVMKKFVKISRARYSTIPHVAALIAAIQKYKPTLVLGIIDMLLECIHSGMEKNDGRDSQRRLAEAFLLGEMYKCAVISDQLMYNVLYLIISLGHDEGQTDSSAQRRQVSIPSVTEDIDTGPDESNQSLNLNVRPTNEAATTGSNKSNIPDPPGDFFRIRLICVMLESCGRALVRSNRRAFEIFLAFLERYLFCKTYQAGLGDHVPLHIDHMLDDVLEGIIMWNRRVVKDVRAVGGSGGRQSDSSGLVETWQTALTRPFSRNRTFEQALLAVQRIEESPTDVALINMPERHIYVKSSQERTQLPSADTPNGVSSLGSAAVATTSDVVGVSNVEDSTKTIEIANGNGNMGISSDANMFAADEEDTIIDGDEAMSGDDELMVDETFNGAADDKFEAEDEDIDFDDVDDDDADVDDEVDDDDDDDEDDVDDVVEDDAALSLKARAEEEEAFAKELAAFTAKEVQIARESNPRVARLDRMVIPMSLMSKRLEEERAALTAQAMNASGESDEYSDDDDNDDDNGNRRTKTPSNDGNNGDANVEFKVLMRKGGKSQLQGLKVPASSSIAVAAKESETAGQARHEETKRLVLGSSVVQNGDEEEDTFEDEVPMQVEMHARAREESIRQQRVADQSEILASLFRNKPRR